MSSHWYARHVCRAPKPVASKRTRIPKPSIWTLFFMPEIGATEERAETRLICLTHWTDQEWAQEMGSNYAVLDPLKLTTFFPNHP